MKNKPDDRRNNVDRIQNNIDNTLENIHRADEMIEITDDEKTRRDLQAKNERREAALSSMKSEIKDEAEDKRKGYR